VVSSAPNTVWRGGKYWVEWSFSGILFFYNFVFPVWKSFSFRKTFLFTLTNFGFEGLSKTATLILENLKVVFKKCKTKIYLHI